MVTDTRQTVRSALSEIEDSDLQLRIRQARTGMLLGHIASISVFSCVFATAMCWLIYPLVDPTVLWPWLAAKWLILIPGSGRRMLMSDRRIRSSAIGIAGSWCCWRLMPSSGAAWAGG